MSAAIPATDQRHFADPPVDAPRDRSARCVDADLANMTVDDYVAYWQTVFTDQRGHHPDQSFPSNQELADQKRAEWSPVVNDAVPPGGDAAFTREVCGLPTLDGTLYSGTPLRHLRGHAAGFGRQTCASIAERGTRDLWESVQAQDADRSKAAAFEYLAHSAITNVCPQLADLTTPPNQVTACADLTPDPSARPSEGTFCTPERGR
ncbi:hypothetical protein [Rhodococcus olei]|uniref:hypothetical protein n=1 Tax=Rhodococcus olei TaxID=2161675 RepID=UPI0031EC993A